MPESFDIADRRREAAMADTPRPLGGTSRARRRNRSLWSRVGAVRRTSAMGTAMFGLRTEKLERPDAWMVGLVGLGLGLRLSEFIRSRSLWQDEAALALGIFQKGFGELGAELPHKQGAPYAYLVLTKCVSLIIGGGERALRLIPLLAGCGAVVAFAALVTRLFSRPAARLTLLLFCFHPQLIFYSAETKPYSLDVLACIVFALLSIQDVFVRPGRERAELVVGVAAPWLSVASVFALSGAVLHRLGRAAGSAGADRRSKLEGTARMCAAWSASLAVVYWVNFRHIARIGDVPYWTNRPCYLPLTGGPADLFAWLVEVFPKQCMGSILPRQSVEAVFLLGLVGILTIRTGGIRAYAAGVIFSAFAASSLSHYSLYQRLALFLIPLLMMGLGALVDGITRRSSLLGLLMSGFVLAMFGDQIRARMRRAPFELRPDARAVLERLAASLRPDDAVYLEAHSRTLFDYYVTRIRGFDAWHGPLRSVRAESEELPPRTPAGRVWTVDLSETPDWSWDIRNLESFLWSSGLEYQVRYDAHRSHATLWSAPTPTPATPPAAAPPARPVSGVLR